jgi:hypothetical protein
MTQINPQATQVFLQLIAKLDTAGRVKLESEQFLPLLLERMYRLRGDVRPVLYSLYHYYEQNGNLMLEPEMCFLLWDLRKTPADGIERVIVRPQMYQQDNIGLYEESAYINDRIITGYNWKLIHDHCLIANMWLDIIRHQGYL